MNLEKTVLMDEFVTQLTHNTHGLTHEDLVIMAGTAYERAERSEVLQKQQSLELISFYIESDDFESDLNRLITYCGDDDDLADEVVKMRPQFTNLLTVAELCELVD